MKRKVTPEKLFSRIESVWKDARGARRMPRRADIDPVKLGTWLQYVSLIDVVLGEPLDFRYRLIGEQVIRAYGSNITGGLHKNYARRSAQGRPIYSALVRCATMGEPQDIESEFRNHNNTLVRVRARVWPLSDDDAVVTAMVGGAVFLPPRFSQA
jgi:hypothetical protein